jgi:hypothetical protein
MQTIAASKITTEKRQDFMIYTGTRLIDHHDAHLFVSNNFTGCRLFRGHVAVRGK